MKTVLDELKEFMESTEFYPSHFSVMNKIKELKDTEKEHLVMFYCRTNKVQDNLIKKSADIFYNTLYENID
jgi:hypothetical protein